MEKHLYNYKGLEHSTVLMVNSVLHVHCNMSDNISKILKSLIINSQNSEIVMSNETSILPRDF